MSIFQTFDLISVIFFTDPNLFKLIFGSDMDMILNHFFSCFDNPILQTLLDICFYIYFFIFYFNDNKINVNIPNFCPPVYIQLSIIHLFNENPYKINYKNEN